VDKPNDTRRSGHRLRSPLGLFLSGAGLLVLLGLVAAVSRAHHTPGGRAGVHSPPAGVGDYLFSIFALFAIAVTLFLIWVVISERDAFAQARPQRRGSMRLLVILALFGLIVAGLSHFHSLRIGRGRITPLQQLSPGHSAKALKNSGLLKKEQRAPEFKWLPVFLATAAGLSVLGVIGVRSLRRSRHSLVESFLLEREFEELVEDTLADLYAESDPRKAIIAAYARVERLFGTRGLPREPSEAPVEYLDRVLPELRASGAALRRLTALFQWAKFSAHDVDGKMRDEAIGALIEVRDELRANWIEDGVKRAEAEKGPIDDGGSHPFQRRPFGRESPP
jgi:hypothetical protein